jgi:hypothetical protein
MPPAGQEATGYHFWPSRSSAERSFEDLKAYFTHWRLIQTIMRGYCGRLLLTRYPDLAQFGRDAQLMRRVPAFSASPSRRQSICLADIPLEICMRLVIAITGATGTVYGVRLLAALRELAVERQPILSR